MTRSMMMTPKLKRLTDAELARLPLLTEINLVGRALTPKESGERGELLVRLGRAGGPRPKLARRAA